MINWLSSVAIVVLLASIILIILPEGKTSYLIKSVLSITVSLSIISPLKSILSNDFTFSFDKNQQITLQDEYLQYVSNYKIDTYKDLVNQVLIKSGVNNADIKIEYSLDDFYIVCIEYVEINLKNAVINSELERIYLIESIKNQISECLNVSMEFVKIYE